MNELRIDPKWRWAAMDEGGKWFFYENAPSVESGDISWGVPGNNFRHVSVFNLNKHIDWRDSLHEIVHEDGRVFLRKHVDVPADGEPVMVKIGDGWSKHYSAGKTDSSGRLCCYAQGFTKWVSGNQLWSFDHWRRPTAEELEV